MSLTKQTSGMRASYRSRFTGRERAERTAASAAPTSTTRPLAALGIALAFVLSIASACSIGGSGVGVGADHTDDAASQRRHCQGPATAEARTTVQPVAEQPEPDLPVTFTDITGSDIIIDDTSRILALDSHGTLATTVYALGLGENLVGRDISTG